MDTQLILSDTAAAIDLLGYLLWWSKGAIIDKTTIAISLLSTQKCPGPHTEFENK